MNSAFYCHIDTMVKGYNLETQGLRIEQRWQKHFHICVEEAVCPQRLSLFYLAYRQHSVYKDSLLHVYDFSGRPVVVMYRDRFKVRLQAPGKFDMILWPY